MKAISPMIAVVLLIAFTIGIGTLVSIFATSLTVTSTGITSNQSEALSRCAGAWINLYSVQSTRVLYSNPNTQAITNPIIILGNGTSITASDTNLNPGETVNENISTIGTNSRVIVRGLCQTLVTAEGTCTTAQDCWDV
ncbi:MAG: hypothetical protein HYW24_03100 [Candidatus Aenigmarchaeota archaeon]|nr:hypothetical protein [Candidatus Aenigmarchaeota archaeon]